MTPMRDMLRDRRGAMAVLGALGLMVVIGGATLATDMARVQLLKSRVQTAVDAATLAGARALGDGVDAATIAARAAFDANLADSPGGTSVVSFAASSGALADGTPTFGVDARLRAPLALAALSRMFGDGATTAAEVRGHARAAGRTRGLEVALVMDNTGSMHGQPIADLREAMRVLTGALFRGAEAVPGLNVAVVPYTATVNIGRQHADMLSAAWRGRDDLFRSSQWKGCVMARSGALAETDAPPSAGGRFDAFFYESTAVCSGLSDPNQIRDDVYAKNCAFHPSSQVHARAPNQWRSKQYFDLGIHEAPMRQDRTFQSEYWLAKGPNTGCPAAILPLTSLRSDVEGMIDQMSAWARGGTLTNWGLAWGWRALSPRWRGLWRHADGAALPATLPRDYGAPGVDKVVVLMTDGDNMLGFDQTSFGRAGEMITNAGADAAMLRVCDAVKREGIVVYVVSLGAVSSGTRDDLRRCASDPETETRLPGQKYFHAPSGAELEAAFRGIGGQLIDVRLVE
jgi:Flp pilus assembly protein TadG